MARIVEDAAKRLGCRPTEIFFKAAITKGHADYNNRATIWLSRYVETHHVEEEVVDFCLDVLVAKCLKGGL